MMEPAQRPPRAQCGFGLIEVLVALTILSIGMLGLAAMQLNSLQNARESLNTTLATIMVRDMNERAWAQQDEACDALLREWQKDVAKIGCFVVSCGFGLIEQASHRTADQVDHRDEVGLISVATGT